MNIKQAIAYLADKCSRLEFDIETKKKEVEALRATYCKTKNVLENLQEFRVYQGKKTVNEAIKLLADYCVYLYRDIETHSREVAILRIHYKRTKNAFEKLQRFRAEESRIEKILDGSHLNLECQLLKHWRSE